MASPSDHDLANAVGNNVVGSTPFTRRDVRIATLIHGRDVAGLKEKTNQETKQDAQPRRS